jgi:hypothetical protein
MLFQPKIHSLRQLKELLHKDDNTALIDRIKENPRDAIDEILAEPDETEYENLNIQSFEELIEKAKYDPRIRGMLSYYPERVLNKVVKEALPPEFRIYRLLVGSLCALVIMISLGMIIAWIGMNSRTAPPSITAIGCMTLGLLAGTFISVPGRSMRNQDIHKPFNRRNRNT